MKVWQVIKEIDKLEVERKDLRSVIADRFNDDLIVEAKGLIKQLDEVTKQLGDLYNLDIKNDTDELIEGITP